MQPVFDEPLPLWLKACPLTLGDLILMMREGQVFPANVNIKAGAQIFHAHGAALDVPAGPALAPRAGPGDPPVFRHPRFPQCEIGNGFLAVFIAGHALTRPHLLEVQVHQLPVAAATALVFFDAEIDGTV